MDEMRVVAVGSPWLNEANLPLPEGPHFTLRQLPELAIVVNNPTPEEIMVTRMGKFEFAVTVVDPVIFLLYRCDPVFGWSDAPFNIHRMNEEDREYWKDKNFAPTDHPMLQVLLVDTNNIIASMRAFTLPPSVATPLFDAIHKQATSPYTEQLYDSILNGIYSRRTPADLVADAIGKGIGGT